MRAEGFLKTQNEHPYLKGGDDSKRSNYTPYKKGGFVGCWKVKQSIYFC